MKKRLVTAAALALALPLVFTAASPSDAAPSAASGTVTVKGHIRSPGGKAIPGVTVSVYSSIDGHHVVKRGRTSRTGRYAIRIARSEWSYQLKVYDHGDADPDDGDGEWASVLKRFDFVGASFRMDEVLHHGARVSGRVYGRDGKPVGAGVRVQAGVGIAGTPGVETITRADGTYRITNAPAGAGMVGFVSPRNGEAVRWYSRSSVTGTSNALELTQLDFEYGRTVSGIDFRFPYLGTISGDTRVDGVRPSEEGSFVDAVLLDARGIEVASGLANSEFAFRDLVPGTYYLEFRSSTPDYPLVTEYYEDSSTVAGAVPLVVDAKGGSVTGLQVELASK